MSDFDDVMLGKVPDRVKKILALKLGNNDRCYLKERKAKDFAYRWKDSYLLKIGEGRKMLKSPRYVAKDEKNKILYFLRDYPLKEGGIRFAGAVLSYRKQLELLDIKTFEGKNLFDIVWLRL